MESYDVMMVLVLVGATVFGAWKGVAWQIASIASIAASYFAALSFSGQLAPMFGDEAPWNRFAAMLTIYVIVSFLVWMAFRVVADLINRVKLKEFDRQIGAIFGAAKGVLFCTAITLFAVSLLPDAQKKMILGSKSGYYIAQLLNKADTVMPKELHEVLDPYLDKAQQTLEPAVHQADRPEGEARR